MSEVAMYCGEFWKTNNYRKEYFNKLNSSSTGQLTSFPIIATQTAAITKLDHDLLKEIGM